MGVETGSGERGCGGATGAAAFFSATATCDFDETGLVEATSDPGEPPAGDTSRFSPITNESKPEQIAGASRHPVVAIRAARRMPAQQMIDARVERRPEQCQGNWGMNRKPDSAAGRA